jgi:glucosyl-dolichyl phosphate glucuronosyltransferase
MSLVGGPDGGHSTAPAIQVTVAICTWNRCELLRQTLEQMTRLQIPVGLEYEILVVDNNSTDATEQVVTSFAARLPLRYVFESTPGKTFACNRAMRETRCDYILWTDDDVLVAETWLEEFIAGAQQFPEAAAFGGTIVPWFTAPPDPEMCDAFPALGIGFCGLERTMPPGVLPDDEHIWGANMAFRMRAVEGLSFDTAFGPSPHLVGGGRDEVLFIRQLRRQGGIVIWLPAMRVKHYVMPSRTTLKYLKSFYWTKAYEQIRDQPPVDTEATRLAGAPRWLWRRWLTATLRYLLSTIGWRSRPSWAFRSGPPANESSSGRVCSLTWLRESVFLRGMIAGYRSQSRGAGHPMAQP